MSINGQQRITELDFDSIRSNLKTYLESQDRFKDYNFDGSGLSILLDVLAYNTHYQSFYTNMVSNEMFLDSAIKRASVISHAKQIGYTPHSKRASVASVQLSYSSSEGSSIVIPAKTPFTAVRDKVTYTFYNTSPVTVGTTGDAPFVSDAFNIVEGQYKTISYIYSVTDDTKITIPSDIVDTSYLTVRVSTSTTDNTGSDDIWQKSTDITGVTSGSQVYFLRESPQGQYELKFGDNIIGKKLDNGNVVNIEYLDTSGSAANFIGRNDSTTNRIFSASTLTNATVIVNSSAAGGSDRESIESVRTNAPLFYQTQDRAVTANDYKSLILANYGNADDVTVFGGEELDPPQYGRVFVTIKPSSSNILTENEKETIKRDILTPKSVVGVIPEIMDPDYTYISFNTKFSYDDSLNNRTEPLLRSAINLFLDFYADVSLSKFGRNLYINKLEEDCRQLDPSLYYVDVDVIMEKRYAPVLNKSQFVTIRFNNTILNTIHDAKDGINGKPAVQSTEFAYKKNDGTIFLAGVDSDMDGNLRIYENVNNNRVTIFSNVGTVDFENGIIEIKDFTPLSATRDGTIRFKAIPREDVVYAAANNVLTRDLTDSFSQTITEYVPPSSSTSSTSSRSASLQQSSSSSSSSSSTISDSSDSTTSSGTSSTGY